MRLIFVALIICSGCVLANNEPKPASDFFVHEIEYRNETLSEIAQWYTGNAENWKLIAGANKGITPKKLQVGDKILIPAELVINERKLPADFIKAPAAAEDHAESDAESVAEPTPAAITAEEEEKRNKIIENLLGK